MAERFSFLLKSAMTESGLGARRLQEQLEERGVTNITYKRISEYLRAVSTPPFEKAREIMDAMEVGIEDDILRESLRENREMIREEKEMVEGDGYNKTISVHVKLRKVLPKKIASETEQILKNRVRTLYGSENNMAKYVENLIAADLQRSLLDEEVDS